MDGANEATFLDTFSLILYGFATKNLAMTGLAHERGQVSKPRPDPKKCAPRTGDVS